MRKHGIAFPNRPHHEIALDDEFTRMAHALIVKPWTNDGKSVEERAADFAKLNYLMSFPASAVDNHNCAQTRMVR